MKRGFTLAEVLITLGVVGVVAVLTIPSVMKNYANKMYVSQLQKTYSMIAEATQHIMNDEHVDSFRETVASATTPASCNTTETLEKCSQGIPYFLNNYFKAAKTNCHSAGDTGCVKSTANFYRRLDNAQISAGINNYCIQTVSGAAICGNYNSGNKCVTLTVDVNGIAQPNVAGRDVFSIDIREDGTLADFGSGCEKGERGTAASSCGSGATTSVANAGSGCLNRIIQDGWKMEY